MARRSGGERVPRALHGVPDNRSAQRRVPEEIRQLNPEERLDRILTGGAFRAFAPIEGEDRRPVVSLSEGSPSHVGCMISQGWPAWGLVLRRAWAVRHGARPRKVRVSSRQRTRWSSLRRRIGLDRSVFDAIDVEWQVRRDATDATLPVTPSDVAALVVRKALWQPSGTVTTTTDGDPTRDYDLLGARLDWGPWATIPRWYFNGGTLELITPARVSLSSASDPTRRPPTP